MLQESEIRSRLRALGAKESDVRTILQQVGFIVLIKALAEYVPTLPEPLRHNIQIGSQSDIRALLKANHDTLPGFSQATFDNVHDEVWEEYFATCEKKPNSLEQP